MPHDLEARFSGVSLAVGSPLAQADAVAVTASCDSHRVLVQREAEVRAAEGAGGVFGAAGCCLDDVVGRGNGCGVCADSVEAAVTTMLITTIRASRFTALL